MIGWFERTDKVSKTYCLRIPVLTSDPTCLLDTLWKLIRQGEQFKVTTNDGEVKNAYWELFDFSGGDEELQGSVEHPDSTVANTAKNMLAMVPPFPISIFCKVTDRCRLVGRDD